MWFAVAFIRGLFQNAIDVTHALFFLYDRAEIVYIESKFALAHTHFKRSKNKNRNFNCLRSLDVVIIIIRYYYWYYVL